MPRKNGKKELDFKIRVADGEERIHWDRVGIHEGQMAAKCILPEGWSDSKRANQSGSARATNGKCSCGASANYHQQRKTRPDQCAKEHVSWCYDLL